MRQRAIVLGDKSQRVHNFHRNSLHALAELVAAAGLEHPSQLKPHHFLKRAGSDRVVTYAEQYEMLQPEQLLKDPGSAGRFHEPWKLARPESFDRAD